MLCVCYCIRNYTLTKSIGRTSNIDLWIYPPILEVNANLNHVSRSHPRQRDLWRLFITKQVLPLVYIFCKRSSRMDEIYQKISWRKTFQLHSSPKFCFIASSHLKSTPISFCTPKNLNTLFTRNLSS